MVFRLGGALMLAMGLMLLSACFSPKERSDRGCRRCEESRDRHYEDKHRSSDRYERDRDDRGCAARCKYCCRHEDDNRKRAPEKSRRYERDEDDDDRDDDRERGREKNHRHRDMDEDEDDD